jgi:hypothetical protein
MSLNMAASVLLSLIGGFALLAQINQPPVEWVEYPNSDRIRLDLRVIEKPKPMDAGPGADSTTVTQSMQVLMITLENTSPEPVSIPSRISATLDYLIEVLDSSGDRAHRTAVGEQRLPRSESEQSMRAFSRRPEQISPEEGKTVEVNLSAFFDLLPGHSYTVRVNRRIAHDNKEGKTITTELRKSCKFTVSGQNNFN